MIFPHGCTPSSDASGKGTYDPSLLGRDIPFVQELQEEGPKIQHEFDRSPPRRGKSTPGINPKSDAIGSYGHFAGLYPAVQDKAPLKDGIILQEGSEVLKIFPPLGRVELLPPPADVLRPRTKFSRHVFTCKARELFEIVNGYGTSIDQVQLKPLREGFDAIRDLTHEFEQRVSNHPDSSVWYLLTYVEVGFEPLIGIEENNFHTKLFLGNPHFSIAPLRSGRRTLCSL